MSTVPANTRHWPNVVPALTQDWVNVSCLRAINWRSGQKARAPHAIHSKKPHNYRFHTPCAGQRSDFNDVLFNYQVCQDTLINKRPRASNKTNGPHQLTGFQAEPCHLFLSGLRKKAAIDFGRISRRQGDWEGIFVSPVYVLDQYEKHLSPDSLSQVPRNHVDPMLDQYCTGVV